MTRDSDKTLAGAPAAGDRGMRRVTSWLRLLFTPAAIAALAFFGWQNRHALAQTLADANLQLLAVSVCLWIAMHFLSALFASVVMSRAENAPSYSTALRIHVRNIPARYLPGGIWGTVGRAADYAAIGVGRDVLATFIALENVLGVTIATSLGAYLLASARGWSALEGLAPLLLIVSLAVVVMLPVAARKRGLPGLTYLANAQYGRSAAVVAASWLIACLSFWFFLRSFPELRADAVLVDVAGAYLLSWSAGFIAFFAPQGVGVFEVTVATLLPSGQSVAHSAVLFAGFRLVILAADCVAWLAFQIAFGRR